MSDSVILFKLLLSAFLFLISIAIYSLVKSKKFELTKPTLYLLLIASRIAIFAIVFLILKFDPQSDVQGYYFTQASNVLNGMLPYVDFQSSYSFFFPYICAGAIMIWNSAKSIILLSILIEIVTFYTWQTVFSTIDKNDKTIFFSSLLYLLNPMTVLFISISGQNQIWLSLFIALSILLILRNRSLLGGFVFATGFLITKFLILFFLPLQLIFTKSRTKYILGFAVPILFYVALSFILKFDLLLPFRAESENISSGNLYYLFSLVNINSFLSQFWDIGVLAIIASSFLLIWKKFDTSNSLNLLLCIVLVFILFLLLNKKSYTNYLVIIFQPLTYLYFLNEITKRKIFIFWLFSTIAAIEPTLWFRLMANYDLNVIWNTNKYGISFMGAISFLTVEIFLIICYTYLLVFLIKKFNMKYDIIKV